MIRSENSSFQAARWTPAGRGAVGTLRLKGPGALEAVHKFFQVKNSDKADYPTDRPVFGYFLLGPDLHEEVVLHKIDDQNLELHIHGGDRICRRILDRLQEQGGEEVFWRDLAGSPQTVVEEAIALLPFAPTAQTAAHLLRQSKNGLQKTLDHLSDLDAKELDDLLILSELGRHLREPFSLLLIGPVNAGKSSLINSLLGFDRVIVDPEAGTTRDAIAAETVLDGWPIRIMDTAGIRSTNDPIEREGIRKIRKFLIDADLILFLLDPTVKGIDPFQTCREALIADSERSEDLFANKKRLTVLNKIDLPEELWDEDRKADREQRDHQLSLRTGEGRAELNDLLLDALLPAQYRNRPVIEQAQMQIPFTERQIELIKQARKEKV
ncbi:MAG: 50S ribosome-binding GTPase [Planctomycetia bacterium]|nr:50S ribosome-binding GTPase [Planctomycetia bacterium]